MKKMFKKAFTLVELLVVIAILGALAAVGIISYSAYTKKANNASDNTLLAQLNHQLVLMEENPKTYTEMREYLNKNTGKEIEHISTLSNNCKYAWNIDDNQLYLIEDGKRIIAPAGEEKELTSAQEKHRYYVCIDSDSEVETGGKYENFACYLRKDATVTDGLVINAGVDCGDNTLINDIRYVNNGTKQDVVIRTNGGTLTIDGKNDTVYHYGFSTIINVLDVNNTNCYDECGTVLNLLYSDDDGKINIRSNAKVYMYQNLSNDTNADLNKIVVDSNAIVYSSVNKGESLPVVDSVDEIEIHKHTENFDVFDEGNYTYVVCKHCGNYAVYDNDGFNDKMSSSPLVGPGASSEFVLVHAEAIYLRSLAANLDIGDTCEISAYFYPSNPTIQKVKWESSDPSVISVEGHGNYCTVTGLSTKANGARANVIARVIDGGDPDVIWASYTIEVHRNPEKPYILGDFVVQSIDEDETITILGFSDEKLEEIKNNPEIGKNVLFPKNTIEIKEYAFAGLDCIETISFQKDDLNNEHVIDIGNGAFFGCSNLKEVNGNVHNINIQTGAFALFGSGKRIETEFNYCNFTISTGNVGIDAETYGSNLKFTSCIFHFVADPAGEVNAATSAVLVTDSSSSTMDTTIKFADCTVIIDPFVKDNDVALVQFAADNHNTNVVFDSACLFTFNEQDGTPVNFADNDHAWLFYCVGGNNEHSLMVYATKESEYEELLQNKNAVFKYSGNYDVKYYVNDTDDFEEPTIEYSGEVTVDTYDKFVAEINSGTHETIIIDGKITKSFAKDVIFDLNGRTLVISEYLEFQGALASESIIFKNGTIKSANANSIMQVYSIHIILNNITLTGEYKIFYTLTNVDVKDEKGNDVVGLHVTDSFTPTQDQGGDNPGGNQGDNTPINVSSYSELINALKDNTGKTIVYTEENIYEVNIPANAVIDLNKNTVIINGEIYWVSSGKKDSEYTLEIKNGNLESKDENCGLCLYSFISVTFDQSIDSKCTLSGNSYVIYLFGEVNINITDSNHITTVTE